MIGLGALASAGTFELEFFSGVIHAGLYFIVIVLLALTSGVVLAGVENERMRPTDPVVWRATAESLATSAADPSCSRPSTSRSS